MQLLLLAFSSFLPVVLAWFLLPFLVHTVATKNPSILGSSVALIATFGIGMALAFAQRSMDVYPLLGLAIAICCVWLSGKLIGNPISNPAKFYNRKLFIVVVVPVTVFLVSVTSSMAVDTIASR